MQLFSDRGHDQRLSDEPTHLRFVGVQQMIEGFHERT